MQSSGPSVMGEGHDSPSDQRDIKWLVQITALRTYPGMVIVYQKGEGAHDGNYPCLSSLV